MHTNITAPCANDTAVALFVGQREGGAEAMDTTISFTAPSVLDSITSKQSMEKGVEGIDAGCEEEYTIATHFVKVKRSGTLTEVTTLWDLVGTEAVSGSLDSVLEDRPGFDRLPSINAFDKVCVIL